MNNIFLSVAGSLEYWRSDAPYSAREDTVGEVIVSPIENLQRSDCTSSARQIDGIHGIELSRDAPLEILVPSKRFNTKALSINERVISVPLPSGSFYRKAGSVYVCSPPLLFLIAAQTYTLHELIALGFELCGTYSPSEDVLNPHKHDPICDVDTLNNYLDSVRHIEGLAKAKRALGYIRDGSASPRETDAYMMLCLPKTLGGFGLSGAKLNQGLEVKGPAKAITKLPEITPDLYWEKFQIAIEYESNEWHGLYASGYVPEVKARLLNQTKLMEDSERRRTFEAMAITLITLTNGEFNDYSELDRLARLIARRADRRISSASQFKTWRTELHGWLKVPILKRKAGFELSERKEPRKRAANRI